MDLTVVLATSPSINNPDITQIEEVIESVRTQISGDSRFLIVCDGFNLRPDKLYSEIDYIEYKEILKTIPDVEVMELESYGHFANVMIRGVENVKTQVFLSYSHDFVAVKKVDTQAVVDELSNNYTIKHLRLNKRHNIIAGWDSILKQGNLAIPALKTSAWSDNPFFMRTRYFLQHIKHRVEGKKNFIENIMMPLYTDAIKRMDFDMAQQLFGTYVYGVLKEGPYIRHLD